MEFRELLVGEEAAEVVAGWATAAAGGGSALRAVDPRAEDQKLEVGMWDH